MKTAAQPFFAGKKIPGQSTHGTGLRFFDSAGRQSCAGNDLLTAGRPPSISSKALWARAPAIGEGLVPCFSAGATLATLFRSSFGCQRSLPIEVTAVRAPGSRFATLRLFLRRLLFCACCGAFCCCESVGGCWSAGCCAGRVFNCGSLFAGG